MKPERQYCIIHPKLLEFIRTAQLLMASDKEDVGEIVNFVSGDPVPQEDYAKAREEARQRAIEWLRDQGFDHQST